VSIKGFAPGWMARCPKCPFEVDLESLGWIRVKAYSWEKRHAMYCPDCEQTQSMRIVHVDEKRNPDQPLGLVLRKVISFVPGEVACYKDEAPADVTWMQRTVVNGA
jgi:hypothetical protein